LLSGIHDLPNHDRLLPAHQPDLCKELLLVMTEDDDVHFIVDDVSVLRVPPPRSESDNLDICPGHYVSHDPKSMLPALLPPQCKNLKMTMIVQRDLREVLRGSVRHISTRNHSHETQRNRQHTNQRARAVSPVQRRNEDI
jgi:hypothetical protein